MLRSLGLITTLILSGCCKPCVLSPKPKPAVVVIKDSDIVKNDDGSFTVSKSWMAYRMDLEQRMKQKLLECRANER